jgi:phospholipid N-methyltransferase
MPIPIDYCSSVQTDTLINVGKLEEFNYWIYKKIKPHIGKRILEVGPGWGSFTRYFLEKSFVVGIDIDGEYINRLRSIYGNGNCLFIEADISKIDVGIIMEHKIDTIVAMNILEHIKNDRKILEKFYEALVQGGKAIITVPAISALYGTLDRYLDHKRRYSRKYLERICKDAGFHIIEMSYINFFSIIGWFISGRILLQERMSPMSLKLFNKMFPLFRFIEDHMPIPCGQNLIAIGEKYTAPH